MISRPHTDAGRRARFLRVPTKFSIPISPVDMSRPRTPTAILDTKGAFIAQPGRKRTGEPQPVGSIGTAPKHLSDDEKKIWREFVRALPPGVGKSSDRWACSILSRILTPMPIYGSCLWQVTGHRLALPHPLQIRRSARNKADSPPTHAGSLTLRTSPVDRKSMFNLFLRPRTVAARPRFPAMVAASPDGGGMARNCSILPPTEN